MTIKFTVYGVPRPGGSKSGFRVGDKIRIVDSCKRGPEWNVLVIAAAREAYTGPLLRCPLVATMRFYKPRPKVHFNSKGLKPDAPAFPTTKPDVLKLGRRTEDALTGVLWADDSQTVSLVLSKHYGEPARAEIEVLQVDRSFELAG